MSTTTKFGSSNLFESSASVKVAKLGLQQIFEPRDNAKTRQRTVGINLAVTLIYSGNAIDANLLINGKLTTDKMEGNWLRSRSRSEPILFGRSRWKGPAPASP